MLITYIVCGRCHYQHQLNSITIKFAWSIAGSESLCGTSFSACNRIYSSGSVAGVSCSCCCCCFLPFCCCCYTLLPASSTDCLESLFMSALIYATVRISALCIFRECLCACTCVYVCVGVCVACMCLCVRVCV